jgi:polyribonucleotide nucleotidyltransferase
MQTVSLQLGNETLVIETGRMAKQANGSVYATYGGSAVLATVCCGSKTVDDLDYVPLTVEYNEKYYAAGKIPGGFLKREARPKDKEILVSRLIDRPMRPLFDKAFKREIQVVPTTVSTDQINPPDIIGIIAASAAVHISDIPFFGPIGAVRISYVNGKLIVNPTFDQMNGSDMEIVVAGTREGVTMVEGGAKEVSEDLLIEAIDLAHKEIIRICDIQDELRKQAGKEKLPIPEGLPELPFKQELFDFAYPLMQEACFKGAKQERRDAIQQLSVLSAEKFADQLTEDFQKQFHASMEEIEQKVLRRSIIEHNRRLDGRTTDQIRTISCEVKVLPRVHGSALFTRGETQALAVATLGTVYDEQIMDDIDGDKREHFMLHYNFPPFSVGEVGRLGTGRREIGHGHLAYRAVSAVLPPKNSFPYTVRIVSEVLESNGSSSMATVCGSSLALQSAGVPILKPVAGIAMGLIQDGDETAVLSDILGDEDHLGDMDFKVAGTKDGITAFQMDIKIKSVSREVMTKALSQARDGRLHILNIMGQTIDTPQEEISEYAPRILKFFVDPEKIGTLIGPSGKVIKGINEKFGVETSIENDGSVTVYSKNAQKANQAKDAFLSLLQEPEIGKVYDGIVKRIVDFGAFIEFLPGKDGLCHISKMAKTRINSVNDVLSLNQEVRVRIVEIDKMGRVNLALILEDDDAK